MEKLFVASHVLNKKQKHLLDKSHFIKYILYYKYNQCYLAIPALKRVHSSKLCSKEKKKVSLMSSKAISFSSETR